MIATLEETDQSDRLAQVYGEVLQIGNLCFKDLSGVEISGKTMVQSGPETEPKPIFMKEKVGKAWCGVGDIILFHPYSYQRVRDPITQDFRDDMVVVNDQDVIAVVDGMDEYKAEYDRLRKEEDERLKKLASETPKW